MGSVSTLSRTISSVADMRLSVNGGQVARTMAIGNNWNKLRFGVRLAVNPNGVATDLQIPEIYFGVCSGTTNMPGSATCANFIGYSWNVTGGLAQNITYNAGTPPYYTGANRWDGVVYRGTTRTSVAGNNGSFNVVADPTTNRSMLLFEVYKGATYTMQLWLPSTAAGIQTDISRNEFLRQMAAVGQGAALTGYAYSGQTTGITMDESTGNLDTLVFWWPLVQQTLEISDFAYQLLG